MDAPEALEDVFLPERFAADDAGDEPLARPEDRPEELLVEFLVEPPAELLLPEERPVEPLPVVRFAAGRPDADPLFDAVAEVFFAAINLPVSLIIY